MASSRMASSRRVPDNAAAGDNTAAGETAAGDLHSLGWWRGWLPLIAAPFLVVWFVPDHWPAWALMWTMAATIYGSLKWLTWRRTPVAGIPLWKHLGYLVAWPGLDAAAFLAPAKDPDRLRPRPGEWLLAAGNTVLGAVITITAIRLVGDAWPYFVGWVGMTGLIMLLHFGSFHLLSCAWRQAGVEARPLMSWPMASHSLSDFWGRRWNTAFRDVTHRFLFRPLTARFGPRFALCSGFVFSGLLHDLVISVPARGGFGGPTLFFTLHGLAMLLERSRWGRRGQLGRGWRGWLFAAILLLAPAGILFHEPFVVRVIVPFLQVLGKIA